MSLLTNTTAHAAVVTGAGSGLGRDIALGLAAKGYMVFGTAMSLAEINELKDASDGRVSLAVCDITAEQAVREFAAVSQTHLVRTASIF